MDCSKRSESAVSTLPEDPLVEILSRVPGKSLCRFKCVSKVWRDLIAELLRRKKLPETLEGFFFVSYSSGGDSGSADGDDEDSGSEGGDGDGDDNNRHGYFADVLGRSVRRVDSCFPFLAEVRVPGIENIRLSSSLGISRNRKSH
ncbi:unnamed protein product [Urochloa humidicola]